MAPTGVYHRVSNYIRGTPAYTIIYVLPFYLFPTTRPSPSLSRDAPSVIRARIRVVGASVIVSSIVTIYVLSITVTPSALEIFRLLGWYPISVPEIARSLLLTGLLFAGPLFEKGVVESGWREWIRGGSLHETLSSWIGWRNFVAGPITEELVFRSLLIPLHLLTSMSPSQIIFLCPLYFGIAHIHHFYEFTLTHPHTLLVPALVRSLIQFGYTTVFGWFAAFVFVRTGSVWAAVLVHSFCNWAGLPRVWGKVEGSAIIGPVGKEERQRGKEDEDPVQVADGKLGIMWTVAYYVLLFLGAGAFCKCLWRLTESRRALLKI
ncbi:MAG: hypothetical protein Q9195_007563 [Heterodermia aff. obscurata]